MFKARVKTRRREVFEAGLQSRSTKCSKFKLSAVGAMYSNLKLGAESAKCSSSARVEGRNHKVFKARFEQRMRNLFNDLQLEFSAAGAMCYQLIMGAEGAKSLIFKRRRNVFKVETKRRKHDVFQVEVKRDGTGCSQFKLSTEGAICSELELRNK